MGDDLFFACRCGLPECEPCLANAEIERLRAENQRLTDENARAWNACNEECQRKEELQAKIDEFAAATIRLRRAAVDADEWFYELAPYDDATATLLAAATKEDDRG